ncbi:hypothetical protein O181_078241 [Austropuccinia psidii MF-1]|uniref:Integrase catalytic domain-containing protein n=1 Tax=Austropuccinia psidii MF-1 TaxID=1389203 RepID=A0A9Q3ICV1_9BASI|nr:hypothetical protein [Austropuccinia psidii MF-1]
MSNSTDSSVTLTEIKNVEKLSTSNFVTWQRGIVSSLDENDPVTLWKNIKDYYASSSAENIASNFGKLFSIKFPPSSSSLSESISSFCSTLKLLCTLSPTLFTGDIMPQALAFYVLIMFPETCRHVSTVVFHSIKVSTKIPTVEEVFKEVELDIIQRSGSEDDNNVALKVGAKEKKELCHKGKHNPLSNHSESECFQLHPEKREAYHKCRNNQLATGTGITLAACNSSISLSDQPILDNGCSNTIGPTNRGFLNTTHSKETLLAANGNSMEVVSEVTLCLKTSIGSLLIHKALVVPSVTSMLVSLGPYLNNGATLKGYKEGADLLDKHGKLILTTKIVNNVLLIDTASPNLACSAISGDPLTIHRTLGHPSVRVALKMHPGIDFSQLHCTSCSLSKSHCLPFAGTFPIPTQTLEVIHMDLCGPITPISRGGNRYIFQLTDGFSHMRFVYLLKEKADTYHFFSKFQTLVENQTSNAIKTVVSDNGGEFVNREFSSLLSTKGIKHLTTAPYTPQQNLVSKRGNRTLLEQIRVFLCDYKVPLKWWGEACSMAAYVLNQTPISSINYSTLISLWDPLKSQNISTLHPFGCTAIMHCLKANRTSKVDTTGICCMLIGIEDGHKNFFLFEPNSKNIYITHTCVFLDSEAFWPKFVSDHYPLSDLTEFPSIHSTTEDSSESPVPLLSAPNKPDTENAHHPSYPDESLSSTTSPIIPSSGEQPCPVDDTCPPTQHPLPPPNVPKGWTFNLVPDEAPNNIESTISSKNIVLGKRQSQPPSRFTGAVSRTAPQSFKEAMASPKANAWMFAIQKEFASLERHGVLEEVEGLDFHDTFAPIGCLATLCFLLGYCAEKDLDLHQMDVKTAFLHGDLDKSPRNWYLKIKNFFLTAGFCPSVVDPCLFIKDSANPCFVFIHVDDLVIGGANLDSFRAEINSTFDMKDLGELKFVLGMKVTRNRNVHLIFLTQELYIDKLLHTFKMNDCKPASTPQVPSSSLEPVSSSLASEEISINYRRAVGLLNYLVTCTRPDLASSASRLSQFLNNPGRVGDNSVISAFCDSDWGSNYDSRSFSGSCLFLHGPVGWKTSKQEVVSLSSTEAEYRSISNCFQDLC